MRYLLALVLVAACGSQQPGTTVPSASPPTTSAGRRPNPDDPYVATTWIRKLGDPRESERAITQLEQLGDPAAIAPLGDAWLAQDRPIRVLQVIIQLARPLTPDEAKAMFVTSYEATGRPASWDKALPYLLRAVTDVDVADPRSVDSAMKAAMALGEATLGLDALIELAQRPVTKNLVAAQIAGIRAIGSFGADAKAAAALIRIVGREPPAHPRTATTKEDGRELEERYSLFLASVGAAVNALAELRAPSAAAPLVLAMYRTPELFMQVRRALVATGPAAKLELHKALRGENEQVNGLFIDRKLDLYCGDRGDQKCVRVAVKEFYASVVLGDFYDPAVVPDLLTVLKQPAMPVYYVDDQPSPHTQHNAVFDALRKIGAPAAAGPIRALWADKTKADLDTRILAIGTYAFVARDATGTAELAKIAATNSADDSLRQEAATALARLSVDLKDIATLDLLAKKYLDASAKKRKAADALQSDLAAATKVLDRFRDAEEAAKAKLLQVTRDSASSADDIKAAAEAAKRAEADFRAAKKKHKDQSAPFRNLDVAAKAYLGYARMFQTHIARIEIAVRCKRDAACYAASLKLTPTEAAANNERYIKELASWSDDDKRGLVSAAIDRAMLELGKMGTNASEHTNALLDAVTSDDRLIRSAILLALPRIAKLPCVRCEAKLNTAIKAGEGKTTIGDLNLETTVLRNYFAWAGQTPP